MIACEKMTSDQTDMNSQEQILQEQHKLERVVTDALHIAQELGADTAEISISSKREFRLTPVAVKSKTSNLTKTAHWVLRYTAMAAKVPHPLRI